jgi:glycosyltransferase involved in cell wall biosynthesis
VIAQRSIPSQISTAAARRPSIGISMPAVAGVTGTGQALTVARSLQGEGWAVTAITLSAPGQPALDLDLRTVNLRWFATLAPLTPLRFREDWLLNLGYEAFDRLAQRQVSGCDVFYGLSHSCLHSIRRASRMGALTVLCACNTFMPEMKRIVEWEYAALGERHPQINAAAVRRVLAEYRAADLIRAESTLVFRSLVDGGVHPDKVFLLPPSVDLMAFQPPLDPHAEFVTAFVGGFSIRKGIHHLLRAWDLLPAERGRLVLHGGGGGWAKRTLAPYAGRSDIEVRSGPVQVTYGEAAVCVVPSIEDGFCRVVLEALASGVPVIVTDRVGAKDLVTDGVEGFVVPSGDRAAIAERIQYLQAHPAVRARMSGAARLRAELCSSQEEGHRLSEVLTRMLASGRTAGP